jgi:ribosomal protein S18 acetylase RimI-like enzyme
MELMTLDRSYTIQTAELRDAPALADLVNSAYRGDSSRQGWTTEADFLGGQRTDAEKVSEMILSPEAVILMGLREGRLEACVYLQKKGRRAYLGMLTVRPELQNAGWGKRLLKQSEAWVRAHWQSDHIEMTVITIRTELIAWYERHGYKKTGRTQPFPYNDERFGIPKVPDLKFIVLEKTI